MKEKCVFVSAIIQYFLLYPATGSFLIEDRYPSEPQNNKNIFIQRERTLTLSCTSNEEFNLCQWIRPDSISCGILNSERGKTCKLDDRVSGMSSWSIAKEGNRKCILTVYVVKETEVGDWQCRLESLPRNGNRKSSRSEEFPIKLLEPSKVTIEGSMELTLRSGAEETVVCSAQGHPKPFKLDWYLNNDPLEVTSKKKIESSDTAVVKESVTAIFPEYSNRIECKAAQIDAMNNEMISRY